MWSIWYSYMKKLNISVIVALFLFIPLVHARDGETKLSTSTKAGQIVIYVSPSGSDRSDGSIKRPLKSITTAQANVRSAKKKGYQDICVILRGGTYTIESTIFFGPEDSGRDEHPVIWKAYEGETPVLSGGIEIGSWQKGDNGIWQTKLERTQKLRQLYIDDKPAKLSQYKKLVKGQGGYGKFLVKGDEPWALRQGEGIDGMLVNKSDMPVIAHPEDLEVRTQTTWTMNRVCVRGVKEEGNQLALLLQQPFGVISQSLGYGTALEPTAYCSLFNAREFITEAGEFYFDRFEKILYYKPREGEDMMTAKVIVPQVESLIQIQGKDLQTHVSNLQFNGLTFAYTSWQLMRVGDSYGACGIQTNCLTVKFGSGDWHKDLYKTTDLPAAAVEVNSADHIVFERNIFKMTGSMGISFENDVVSSRIEGNFFQFIGGTAINIGNAQQIYIGKQNGDNEGFGPYNIDNNRDKFSEKEEGLCRNILISNNLIRETGIEHQPSVALMAYFGDGLNITHNDIAYAPYTGINLGWGWGVFNGTQDGSKIKPQMSLRNNSVTCNRIGHVLQTLHDGGGIYLLDRQVPYTKDSTKQQYTNVCNNYFYDFGGLTRAAIHPDNGAQYFIFKGNVFNHIAWSLIKVSDYAGKGHYRVENNYSNTQLYFTEGNYQFAPYTLIKGNVDVENENWPEEAKIIIDNSGLEEKYHDLLSLIITG